MIELRLPKIDAPTVQGKINQIQDYLFQTIRQINLNFEDKDASNQDNQNTKETINYMVKNGGTNVEEGIWAADVTTGKLEEVTATYMKIGKLVYVYLSGYYTTGNENVPLAFTGLPYKVKGLASGNFSHTTMYFYVSKGSTNVVSSAALELVDKSIYITGWSNGTILRDSLTSDCVGSGTFRLSAVYQTE